VEALDFLVIEFQYNPNAQAISPLPDNKITDNKIKNLPNGWRDASTKMKNPAPMLVGAGSALPYKLTSLIPKVEQEQLAGYQQIDENRIG